MKATYSACAVLALLLALTSAAQGVSVGQIDDFQDGTLQGWAGASPVLVPDGGPSGAGDNFLQISSGTQGLTRNLAAFKTDERWTGDYGAAGVTGLAMHLRNSGPAPLAVRAVLFVGDFERATSLVPVIVPPDSQWHAVVLPIGPGDLVSVLGALSPVEILANVQRLMLRHDAEPASSGGDNVDGRLGVDNITAVPEPSGLLAAAVAAAFLERRRRCRSLPPQFLG